jgi:hypothetical protein
MESFADQKDFAWMSGDYSAATDNLRAFLSYAAMDEVCNIWQVSPWLRRQAQKALVGHSLDYSKERDGVNAVAQCNGQLMGSPLSFPILCIVNAALCRRAMNSDMPWSGLSTPLRDLPLKVNGDDCVFGSTAVVRQSWKEITSSAGLSPSIGKCYSARDWFQINSQNFWAPPQGDTLKYVKFVNCGYLRPFMTRGGELRSASDLGALAREFLLAAPGDPDRNLTIFLRCHRNLLSSIPAGMSWWLPEKLGGLGLPIVRDDASLVSYRQLLLAEYLLQNQRSEIARGPMDPLLSSVSRCKGKEVPRFVREVLTEGSKLTVLLPPARDPFQEEGAECPYSKQLPENFSALFWALHPAALDDLGDPDLVPDDGTRGLGLHEWFKRSFGRVWKRSLVWARQSFDRKPAPLSYFLEHEILGYKAVLPGGMTSVLRKLSDAPRDTHRDTTAMWDLFRLGILKTNDYFPKAEHPKSSDPVAASDRCS